MAGISKNNPNARVGQGKDATHIKYVRKAGSWCKTVIKDGKQNVTFYHDKACTIQIQA